MKKVWIFIGLAIASVIILLALKNKKLPLELNKYTYIETSYDNYYHSDQSESKEIKAVSDSAAYLEAFEDYLIAIKATEAVKKRIGSSSKSVTGFKLLNSLNDDISTTVTFQKKDSIERALVKRISGIDLDKSASSISTNNITTSYNPELTKKLLPLFTIKKDEFDPSGEVYYKPKTAPNYVNYDAVFCYFTTVNDKPENLRFRLQYENEDWLFIQKCQFLIDGKAIEFYPLNVESDSGNGGRIWEWFDESISVNNELIQALYTAKSAKIKILGRQYHDVVTITPKQLKSIKNTIDLYKSMGGE